MLATVCNRHRQIVPAGERCSGCARENAERGNARRAANNAILGRRSPHWRRLSFNMIRRHRRDVGPFCPACLVYEQEHDHGSKLTVDLVRGGDHRTAAESECRILCRRCHGKAQGDRR